MNQTTVSPIQSSGNTKFPFAARCMGLNEQELLLFAAWAHGMKAGDIVHRSTLFAYVQTHIERKSEQQLQGRIEKSEYWKGETCGLYELTRRGASGIAKRFDGLPPKASLNARYRFTCAFERHEFSVEVSPIARGLIVSVDRFEVKGTEACRRLEVLGVSFRTKSTSAKSRVWNWIVQDGQYTWQRLK